MNAGITHAHLVCSARSTLALATLWLASLGCIFEGKVGDEPGGGTGEDSDVWGSGVIESSTSMGPGHSSAPPEPGGTMTSTTGMSCGDVDGATALALCGIVLMEPEPGAPIFHEGIECEGGGTLDVVVGAQVHLFANGECLCTAMGCGDPIGGTTGSFPGEDSWGTGDATTDATATAGDTTGGTDACGPYPPGTESYVCGCETCSAVLTNVDEQWLFEDADLGAVCECMCGWAGCGMPA
ncbi:hypothetical protein [Paraliomyxa miuraensis]|uniref:hypothetical protein n=1 Tax=Paraliomyxa miuraensis TaxID=376150 RepID=UPI00225BE478|nr:hypothetical protein [Paraliomyxa miuraensis]MCX4242001.1 hypothetical protein [Paraliomyxa miuraensis]